MYKDLGMFHFNVFRTSVCLSPQTLGNYESPNLPIFRKKCMPGDNCLPLLTDIKKNVKNIFIRLLHVAFGVLQNTPAKYRGR